LIKEKFLPHLHFWYKENKRDLPFRHTTDAYKIWLSEIILQQTRVEQGLPYYIKFLELFPEVEDLAKASEEDVLKAWQGLGYYSRARNLHFTANMVVDEFGGVFPTQYEDLIKLKGIGDYTASAISSFSSKEVVPVLDGNVYRFMSRLIGIETPINTPKAIKEFKQVLVKLIDEKKPDTFNQAIIEFGALHCTPTSPSCDSCPFSDSCFAFTESRIKDFPVKLKKKKPVERYLNFYLVKHEESIFITKRKENSIWKNLYEFPFVESKEVFMKEMVSDDLNETLKLNTVSGPFKHLLSHQKIMAKLMVCELNSTDLIPDDWIKISKLKFDDYPIHRLMEKMVESIDL